MLHNLKLAIRFVSVNEYQNVEFSYEFLNEYSFSYSMQGVYLNERNILIGDVLFKQFNNIYYK